MNEQLGNEIQRLNELVAAKLESARPNGPEWNELISLQLDIRNQQEDSFQANLAAFSDRMREHAAELQSLIASANERTKDIADILKGVQCVLDILEKVSQI